MSGETSNLQSISKTGNISYKKIMKIAKVIPIYKTGNRHELSTYRPVSLLPDCSMYTLYILCDQHYGFRAYRTTKLTLMEFVEEITISIEKK